MSTGTYSTARSHTGNKSIFITGAGRLRHSFDTALDRTVEVWFYDDGVGTFNIPLFGNLDVFAIGGGLNRAVSVTHYYFYDGASSQVSTVPLSTGWHCIQIHVTAAGSVAIIKIDNVECFNGAIGATPQALVELYNVSDSVYCDDVRVYAGIPQPVLVPVFQDDSEVGIPTDKGWTGTASYSTDITPHSGTRCLKVLGFGAAETSIGTIANRTLEVWFYDDARGVTYQDNVFIFAGFLTGTAFNFNVLAPHAGINWYNGVGGDTNYSYSPDWHFPFYAVSSVARTTGWRKLQIYSDSTNTNGKILIDGVIIFNGAWDPLSLDGGLGKIWLGAGLAVPSYFDDIKVYDGDQT